MAFEKKSSVAQTNRTTKAAEYHFQSHSFSAEYQEHSVPSPILDQSPEIQFSSVV
jgi:hypothetical protein